MKNEFVTYEQALKLKELGFDEDCLASFFELKNPSEGIFELSNDGSLKASLKQQVFRWFREKYDLDCYIESKSLPTGERCYDYTILNDNIEQDDDGKRWRTYEEAESSCIDKLIETLKTIK